ncbi:dTDP-4-dehydrorhamnose reductase [Candidatus Omnitrophota bacterium]
MKIAVIGANGQLGSDICENFSLNGDHVFRLTHNDIEIVEKDSVYRCLQELKPEIVVNTAAFHNVERCETEPEKAFCVNAQGTENVAMVTNDLNATLFHISTDYVFDGKKKTPYIEGDTPHPINIYGKSKLAGEQAIQSISRKYVIMRVCGIYGRNPCRGKEGLNFIEKMLKLSRERDEVRVVDDEELTPTFTQEIGRQIVAMRDIDDYGIYHTTAEGSCSWFEFAQELFRLKKITTTLHKADCGEFSTVVVRPKYSVLENKRLKDKKINIFKHWIEGLQEYIETLF